MKTHVEDVNELADNKIKAIRKRASKAWKGNVHSCCARAQKKFQIDVKPYQHQYIYKHTATEKQEILFQTIKLSHK